MDESESTHGSSRGAKFALAMSVAGLCFCPLALVSSGAFFFVQPLGLVGLIAGLYELRAIKTGRAPMSARRHALAAVWLGGISTALSLVSFLFLALANTSLFNIHR